MKSVCRPAVLIALTSGYWLSGCSAETAAASGPTDDPCALVSTGEVRKLFPGAAAGVRDHILDKYGIAGCTWDSPSNTVAAQIFQAKGSAEDEARGRMMGSVDPFKAGAGAKIQYVKLAGLGDEATAVVEPADAGQGLLSDTAVIAIRHGTRMAVLSARLLIDGNRAATIKALEDLGRSAASRL
jgi:hypothetical protein